MERKIGEIFEYNGEWYQCVEGTKCRECDFSSNNVTCDIHGAFKCTCKGRSDETSVVFKKLEKVGEPYMTGNKLIQRYKIYPTTYCINVYGWYYQNLDIKSWTIDVEIKQIKEDMGDNDNIRPYNELFSPGTVSNTKYLAKDMEEYKMYDAKEDIPEFDKVVDECLFGKENPNLKPFSLEAAKSGKPVCTRDGRKARIICFDGKGDQPIIALVEAKGNKDALIEKVERYFINGHSVFEVRETNDDLMMLPEKKEGWVNVYKRENEYVCENECNVSTGIAVYKSEGEAKRNIDKNEIYVNTIKITWEE